MAKRLHVGLRRSNQDTELELPERVPIEVIYNNDIPIGEVETSGDDDDGVLSPPERIIPKRFGKPVAEIRLVELSDGSLITPTEWGEIRAGNAS